MRIVAVSNQKGGVGKTSTAVNLAAAMGERGRRVLVIDLDAQSNASTWLGIRDAGRGLLEVLTQGGALNQIIRPSTVPGVDCAPSSAWLLGVERTLAGEVGAELILRRRLADVPRDRWDIVLIDTPPNLGLLTLNALAATGEALIPLEPRALALEGLAMMLKTLGAVKERLNPALTWRVLITRATRTRHAREVEERLRARLGAGVLRTRIRENTRLSEAPSFAQSIMEYDPASHGTEDHRALADEFLEV